MASRTSHSIGVYLRITLNHIEKINLYKVTEHNVLLDKNNIGIPLINPTSN